MPRLLSTIFRHIRNFAAFAGFKGVGAVEEHFAEKKKEAQAATNADDDNQEDDQTT